MNSRPISGTLVAGLLIAVGTMGIAYHITEFRSAQTAVHAVVLAVFAAALFHAKANGYFRRHGTQSP